MMMAIKLNAKNVTSVAKSALILQLIVRNVQAILEINLLIVIARLDILKIQIKIVIVMKYYIILACDN